MITVFFFFSDTIPPTAYVTAATSFTSSLNVSVNISFSEPCIGEGFRCKSVNACNVSILLSAIAKISQNKMDQFLTVVVIFVYSFLSMVLAKLYHLPLKF